MGGRHAERPSHASTPSATTSQRARAPPSSPSISWIPACGCAALAHPPGPALVSRPVGRTAKH
eukprot:4374509-Pleurochrysis_carterae.AAC.1